MSYKVTVLKSKPAEKTSTISVFSDLVEFVLRPTLLAEVLRSESINMREGNAHTKTRGEVRGGGRKPWKQKGTGRARHGSTRSPIWIGGGITFGPRNTHNWHSKINKKARITALKSLLKDRLEAKNVYAFEENFSFQTTKEADSFLTKQFKSIPKNVVLLYCTEEKSKFNGFSNLSVSLINAGNMKLNQLVKGMVYIMTPQAIEALEQRIK